MAGIQEAAGKALPGYSKVMANDTATLILAVAAENMELRLALAEAQDSLVEMAVDAGDLHARIEALGDEIKILRAERDAWFAQAQGLPARLGVSVTVRPF